MKAALSRLSGIVRVERRLLLAFLLLSAAVFAFGKLASEVMEGDTLAFDRLILRGLRSAADPAVPIGPQWLEAAMIDLTALGGTVVLTLITALVAGYLLVYRKPETAAFLVVAIAGGAALSTLLKAQFLRPRPDIVTHLVEVQSASFPSGHAMNSAITYLTLGALLAQTEKNPAVRTYLVAAAVLLTVLIGASRVYLGVHWPSDVLAGWCVGAAWSGLCALIALALQSRRGIEPPTSGR